jgi:hypothetical protein
MHEAAEFANGAGGTRLRISSETLLSIPVTNPYRLR